MGHRLPLHRVCDTLIHNPPAINYHANMGLTHRKLGPTPGSCGSATDDYPFDRYIDEPIAMIDASGSGEDTYYYHRNRQFSIVGLTDDIGTVIERYAYTAYGEVTILAPYGTTVRTTSDVGNAYTYTGRRLDDETGLLYFRARYHDSVLGRFLERDPLGYPDGLNTYAAYYVVRGGVDPMGESRTQVPDIDPKKGSKNKGVKTITVKKCSVVIFHEHGKAGDEHTWKFSKCSGGATIGCYAKPSNDGINNDNYAGTNAVRRPPYDGEVIATDPTVADDYFDMAKRGGSADNKAIKLCSCECKKVVVHTLGSLAMVGPGGFFKNPKIYISKKRGTLDWYRTYDCDTKNWTFANDE